ncbi:hypothetical protein WJX73_005910 [Symbiochloris irregularis]|uniref:Protein kinase domain-containing protein n=1 Tax=Symbiochloris irregularis TaxID=706552 RepID=A0AAW1PHX9_9CHLO
MGKDGYLVKGQLGTQEGTTMKLMQNKKTKELVAAKFIPRVQGAGLTKNTEREIVNHRKLVHPNIIRFKEVYMTDLALVIVMEYASGGPLEERIATSGPLAEEDAKKFYKQLVDGMGYCHDQNIFHRDLRMDNILLHGSYFESTLKISNFGYSKSSVLDSMAKTAAVGAPAYTPPELLLLAQRSDGSAYDGAAIDVWASGIILYCMLTGKLPFLDPLEPNAINAKVMQRIVNGRYEFPKDQVKVSPECLDLIAKIFNPKPDLRIKTSEIKRHPWLSGLPLQVEPPPTSLEQSPQTEDDIITVVQRARERRKKAAEATSDAGSTAPQLGLCGLHDMNKF